jgi:DNA primase
MARIPDSELERIKREVPLLELVRGAGIALKRHGADWIGLCPFHRDTNPSLVITPAKNLWHCLGACQAGGSVIDWVMRREGVSFRRAVEDLRTTLPGGSGPSVVLDASLDDAALLRAVMGYYHRTLLTSPEAIAYLEKRGLNHRHAIESFQLGYANRTLAYQLPEGKPGKELRARLQTLGIFRASGHEHLNGSLVVSVCDETGNVVEAYGRKLRDDLREGTPRHLYLPGPHRGVWNAAGLQGAKEVILCEALLDALTFWCAGYRHVTASYGINGFTAEHLALFQRLQLERILIAYDRDEAGERAAEQLAGRLTGAGFRCYRVLFPRGLDANAYALENTPAEKSLGLVLRHAVFVGQGAAPEASPAPTAPTAAKETAAAALFAASSPAPPAASPEPPPPSPEIPVALDGGDVLLTLEDRHYRIRGLSQNTSPDLLKVNLLVRRGAGVHADTLDLYAARPRTVFVAQAAAELGVDPAVLRKDLGTILLRCERLQGEGLASLRAGAPASAVMTPAERDAALALLRDPQLLDRVLADFERVGVVGEEANKLVGYFAALSRKLPEPLAVIVQSATAAGKTSLVDAVLSFLPPEERVQYSAVTGQALFYLAETDLRHKVLSIVEEEGAERASYALKLLQSEGELTIASTGKDPKTGKLITHAYRVEGPVMIFLTTTAVELDEELVNRALVLTVDEDRQQTRAIHQAQRRRRTLEGRLAQVQRDQVLTLHRNAQRLLEPVAVVNPYAPQLTFSDAQTRTRRDHEKYLTLIDAIALLHQHQRERHTIARDGTTLTYIEVTPHDIALANRLAAQVLGHTLDELPPQTRRFVTQLDPWVREQCAYHHIERAAFRFLARDLRAVTGLSATQVKLHLHRLLELEYVLLHRATRGIGVAYELVYDGQGQDGTPFLTGLIDVERLTAPGTTADRSGSGAHRSDRNSHRSDTGRPSVGIWSGGGRSRKNRPSSSDSTDLPLDTSLSPESTAADGAAVAS